MTGTTMEKLPFSSDYMEGAHPAVMRLVTSWATTDADADALIKVLRA